MADYEVILYNKHKDGTYKQVIEDCYTWTTDDYGTVRFWDREHKVIKQFDCCEVKSINVIKSY